MASAIIDGIGLIAGVLGIIGFFLDNVPGSQPQGASVRIKAGLGDNNSSNLGGSINTVDGYDFNNNYIGSSGGGSTDGDGGIVDLTINQYTPGVQANYITVQNSDDATCIAWVSVKQFDGADDSGGSWTGDVGYNCGNYWYYGNQVAGTIPSTGEDYLPYCSWLDGDHTNGIPYGAMKIDLRAYGTHASDTIANDQACGATIFSTDSTGIDSQPAKRSLGPKRRQWIKDRLVMSAIKGHTAKHLCDHPKSYGPDFVGADGYFCDMENKSLAPLCSTRNVTGCVRIDKDKQTIHIGTVAKSRFNPTGKDNVLREYKEVTEW